MKTCAHCKQLLPNDRFNADHSTVSGLKSWCRRCGQLGRNHTAQNARYRARHPERAAARNRVWYLIRIGHLPRAKTLACVECGQPAARYDHHKGYARENWHDVQPVCVKCCAKREAIRKTI